MTEDQEADQFKPNIDTVKIFTFAWQIDTINLWMLTCYSRFIEMIDI